MVDTMTSDQLRNNLEALLEICEVLYQTLQKQLEVIKAQVESIRNFKP